MARTYLFVNKCKLKVVLFVGFICIVLFALRGKGNEERQVKSEWNSLYSGPVSTLQAYAKRCDVDRFKERLDLSRDHPIVLRDLLSTCNRIMYNRVPKCASRALRDVFVAMAPHNNFTHIYIHENFNKTDDWPAYYVNKMQEVKDNFVLTSHFPFHDFSYAYQETPVYINVIREPVEWFKSMYFYKFHGSNEDPKPRKNVLGTTTVHECMVVPRCFTRVMISGPLRYLCGPDDRCKRNASFAYEKSKKNIDKYYLVIGLQSNLSEFIEVLEYLMPHIFHDIQQYFIEGASVSASATRTVAKEETNATTDFMLRDLLRYDYKLYAYVEEQFTKLLQAVRFQRSHAFITS